MKKNFAFHFASGIFQILSIAAALLGISVPLFLIISKWNFLPEKFQSYILRFDIAFFIVFIISAFVFYALSDLFQRVMRLEDKTGQTAD